MPAQGRGAGPTRAPTHVHAPMAGWIQPLVDPKAKDTLTNILMDVRYRRGPGSAKSNGRDIFGA
jgi:hypothetical protein